VVGALADLKFGVYISVSDLSRTCIEITRWDEERFSALIRTLLGSIPGPVFLAKILLVP